MSLTKLPLGRNNSVMTSLFQGEFGSDIPAGDGKLANLFFTVYSGIYEYTQWNLINTVGMGD
jgi:hypothetical protein